MKNPTTCGVSTDARSNESILDVNGMVAFAAPAVVGAAVADAVVVRTTRNGRDT
jgi:hypothetical protein